jgi:plasmid maintenance system antidote protein VapI
MEELEEGRFIEYYLRFHGITVAELAEMAGVSVELVNRIINGTARLIPESSDRILKALDIQLTFVGDIDND